MKSKAKEKAMFVILDFGIGGIKYNKDWTKRDAIQFAKQMTKDGHTSFVFEGVFVKGFEADIKVVELKKEFGGKE